jgi:hypothetical protein
MPKIEFAQEPATISSLEVLKLTTKTLRSYLNLLVNGHKYTDETVFHLLVKASVDRSSIEDACGQLDEPPHSNAVRYQLNKDLLLDIKTLEDRINDALVEQLPPEVKRKETGYSY